MLINTGKALLSAVREFRTTAGWLRKRMAVEGKPEWTESVRARWLVLEFR